jgi:hypothetical protein
MEVTHPHPPQDSIFKSNKRRVAPKRNCVPARDASQPARDEINAFIAIRDILLADAEKSPTSKTIDSAATANAFVENCLRNGRSHYGGQSVPEPDAIRERKVCDEVKQRIGKLRAAVAS